MFWSRSSTSNSSNTTADTSTTSDSHSGKDVTTASTAPPAVLTKVLVSPEETTVQKQSQQLQQPPLNQQQNQPSNGNGRRQTVITEVDPFEFNSNSRIKQNSYYAAAQPGIAFPSLPASLPDASYGYGALHAVSKPAIMVVEGVLTTEVENGPWSKKSRSSRTNSPIAVDTKRTLEQTLSMPSPLPSPVRKELALGYKGQDVSKMIATSRPSSPDHPVDRDPVKESVQQRLPNPPPLTKLDLKSLEKLSVSGDGDSGVNSSLPPTSTSTNPQSTTSSSTTTTTTTTTTQRDTPHPIKMPHSPSSFLSGPQLTALKQFASSTSFPISDRANLWDSLLTTTRLPQPRNNIEAQALEMATRNVSTELDAHNDTTQNFTTLLLWCISLLRHIRVKKEFAIEYDTEVFNALFLVRLFAKFFIETRSQAKLHCHFERDRIGLEDEYGNDRLGATGDDRLRAELLIEELFELLIHVTASSEGNYSMYVEALNTVIVLCSTQLMKEELDQCVFENNYFLDMIITKMGHYAPQLIPRLLENFLTQQPGPNTGGGLIYNAFSYLFSKRTSSTNLAASFSASGNGGKSAQKQQQQQQNQQQLENEQGNGNIPSQIADKSLLLLLLLVNQGAPKSLSDNNTNAFRDTLRDLMDSGASHMDLTVGDKENQNEHGRIGFSVLYKMICARITNHESLLLLYQLVSLNRRFRSYVLSRMDSESLILPILKLVYETLESPSSLQFERLYLLLMILCIFSQDEYFNYKLHKTPIPSQPWYTERVIKSLTLGSLGVLVVLRALQINLSVHKDPFLHGLSIAILVNMSGHVVNMHSYVAIKLMNLFELGVKRFLKLLKRLEARGVVVDGFIPGVNGGTGGTGVVSGSKDSLDSRDSRNDLDTGVNVGTTGSMAAISNVSTTSAITSSSTETEDDLLAYHDVLALILEVMNTIITHSLHDNPQLIYALLHRQGLFTSLSSLPRFTSLIQNIESTVSYFALKLEQMKTPSLAQVLEMIRDASNMWGSGKKNAIVEFEKLRFAYFDSDMYSDCENEKNVDSKLFGVSVVWRMVVKKGWVYWETPSLLL